MPKESLKAEKLTFPKRLFNVVNSSEYISWTEDGESFYISDLQHFESKVMKTQFNNTTLLSFFRQVQLYGFKRTVDGRKTRYQMRTNNAYFQHPDFKRGRPDLLLNINRIKRKRKPISETECSSKPKLIITKYIPYDARKERKIFSKNRIKQTTNQIKTSHTTETDNKAHNSPELQAGSSTSTQLSNNTLSPYLSSHYTNITTCENPIYFHSAPIGPPQVIFDSFNLVPYIKPEDQLQGITTAQSEPCQAYNSYTEMNTNIPYSTF
ncbi:winged helix DNA-binding domain-containing protein [Conidiobolus coronatus NRRL 28638]|uniref:Winged helix DNA-binding domain-containing protein n=1 Tax=Conidiobolus coronatus (strain ATCC 28846 / CBS 209.66 / NRRL 28638) TaxID=796925 RepID=A0A137NQT8_CONC2|nr:winged helix DNA-binding domain-containing protein [Conidiobolus coronatus NRRL 28638]|eukprot:KXN65133.1 winged helix DNA-binding domain-containing protein [Conidiobolus coronatus NRRL 28638]